MPCVLICCICNGGIACFVAQLTVCGKLSTDLLLFGIDKRAKLSSRHELSFRYLIHLGYVYFTSLKYSQIHGNYKAACSLPSLFSGEQNNKLNVVNSIWTVLSLGPIFT